MSTWLMNGMLYSQRFISIPKFLDFLQPPNTSNILSCLPPDGPVIIFNIHKDWCDALTLIPGVDEPLHIPLINLGYDQAVDLGNRFHKYLQLCQVHMPGIEDANDWGVLPFPQSGNDIDTNKILHILWKQVVKPILDGLGYLVGVVSITNIFFLMYLFRLQVQTSIVFGGAPLVHLLSFQFMLQEFMERIWSMGPAFMTLLSLCILTP